MDVRPSPTVIGDVAAEVPVPADGTLSRVLHSDDAVRVVAFAFDAGQELTEHAVPVPAVVQVISGRISMDLGGECAELGPRAWVHMPPRTPHTVRAVQPSIVVLTMLRTG